MRPSTQCARATTDLRVLWLRGNREGRGAHREEVALEEELCHRPEIQKVAR